MSNETSRGAGVSVPAARQDKVQDDQARIEQGATKVNAQLTANLISEYRTSRAVHAPAEPRPPQDDREEDYDDDVIVERDAYALGLTKIAAAFKVPSEDRGVFEIAADLIALAAQAETRPAYRELKLHPAAEPSESWTQVGATLVPPTRSGVAETRQPPDKPIGYRATEAERIAAEEFAAETPPRPDRLDAEKLLELAHALEHDRDAVRAVYLHDRETGELLRRVAERLRAVGPRPEISDAAEMLWIVLANVSGGDWTKQSKEWQDAAARWRDNYFAAIGKQS